MSQSEYFHASRAFPHMEGVDLRALSTLGERSFTNARTMTSAGVQDMLLDAVRLPDRVALDQAVAKAVAAGISHRDIANLHIPEIARAMGQAWLDDKLDFASVSIGCARLQGYLRRKGLDWSDTAHMSAPSVARVLLIVPDFEQHTLGATLLAGQLRAQGVDVATAFCASMADIDRAVTELSYDAILISSSRSETIALLRATVFSLHEKCADAPIIIGGNVLEQIPDALDQTGADFTAKNCQNALDIVLPQNDNKVADSVGHGR